MKQREEYLEKVLVFCNYNLILYKDVLKQNNIFENIEP